VRRTTEPNTDAAAMTMRTTVLLVTLPFPGHVCTKKKKEPINKQLRTPFVPNINLFGFSIYINIAFAKVHTRCGPSLP